MILDYIKKNKKGEDETFYTHSSFIDPERYINIHRRMEERNASTNNLIVALTIGSAWVLCILFSSCATTQSANSCLLVYHLGV